MCWVLVKKGLILLVRGAAIIRIGYDVTQYLQDKKTGKQLVYSIVQFISGVAGDTVGTYIGSLVFPGVGSFIGGIIGGIIGEQLFHRLW